MVPAEGSKKNQDRGVQYKLYIDSRSGGSKFDVLRYHVTTRNFFAFLLRRPLVGFTFYQALVDLHKRLEEYLSPNLDCAVALQSYLVMMGLVNVSNEPRAAAGLLAWSEDVRWNDGWREAYVYLPCCYLSFTLQSSPSRIAHQARVPTRVADLSSFVHSVGMYDDLNDLQECADVSLATTAHLDRAHLELQARIHEAEDRLTVFYFDDAHFAQEDMSPTVRAASVRFRKFLRQYYEKEYQTWPIRRGQPGLWLNRIIVGRLQEDFNALYEYNVDRNMEWNGDGESEERKDRALLKPVNALNIGLDGEDLRMLSVLRNSDCRLNSSPIPHPYPLLPPSVPGSASSKKSVFGSKKKDKAREARIAHAYAEASNASQLIRERANNDLLKAYIRFEKADQSGDIDPREARRERWIIIYCVLQTLSGISVDVPNMSFDGDVSYFLNARLTGLPPWCPTDRIFQDPCREQSHCWTTARTWSKDHFERWATGSRSDSYTESNGTSQRRPLSPESQPEFHNFFGSDRDTMVGEVGANELYHKDDFSPVTETTLGTDPSHCVVPAKFAAVAGIDRYSTKPLPIRPYHGGKRDPEVRRPK